MSKQDVSDSSSIFQMQSSQTKTVSQNSNAITRDLTDFSPKEKQNHSDLNFLILEVIMRTIFQ